MKANRILATALALALALPVYVWTSLQLRGLRAPAKLSLNVREFPFPVNFYRVAAGEFAGLSADFMYLDIAALFGGRDSNTLSESDWDKVEKAFAVATGLDTFFEPTFRAVQAYLPWSAARYHEAIDLLEPVHEKRSWHWLPTFFIAFDYYFFLKDNGEASRYFLQAAQREQAPGLLATMGSRLAAESGNAAMGINFLRRMMETAKNESERETYRTRIEALQGVVILEDAVKRYRADFGRNPPDLLMLQLHGYVRQMPRNPYHPNYFYLDGVVRFDPFPTRGVASEQYRKQIKRQRPEPPPLLKKPVPQA